MSRRKRRMPPVGSAVRVVRKDHPRVGKIGRVFKHEPFPGTLPGWSLVKFGDGMVACLKVRDVRAVMDPLTRLAVQADL